MLRTEQALAGRALIDLSERIDQVIDGVFRGFDGTAETPWVEICAIDSSEFDVYCDDDDVHAAIRARFSAVDEIR